MYQRNRILLSLSVFMGCEQLPAIVPESRSVAIEEPQTTVQPTEPETTADATTDAHEITGKVVGIVDGDTLDILTIDITTTRISLNGIDAPERGQGFGTKSIDLLSELVGEKTVRVEKHGEDRYGRTIGDVFVRLEKSVASDPEAHVNFVMVANGFAWHYVKYDPDNKKLADAEKQAREKKLGLWVDRQPVAPWEWRKLSKEERDKLR